MTPAQKLAKSKPHRNGKSSRTVYWKCRLREMRHALGLSLRDVEKGTGVNNATLSHTERGADPSLRIAVALARFFGTPVESIWERVKK